MGLNEDQNEYPLMVKLNHPLNSLNSVIRDHKEAGELDTSKISDGEFTFEELYKELECFGETIKH